QISKHSLKNVVIRNEIPQLEETGFKSDLGQAIDCSKQILELEGTKESARDALLARELHKALSDIPMRVLTDPFLWHWMTTIVFKEYVLERWVPSSTDDLESWLESNSGSGRFLGRNSNAGFARNAIARLFWGAELTQEEGNYDLTTIVFSDADLHQSIFERNLGLESRLVRICIRKMQDVEGFGESAKKKGLHKEKLQREAFKIMKMLMQTTVIEAYSPEMLENFVQKCMDKSVEILLRDKAIEKDV
ncbi:MAG: DUF6339 family protein, partial [Acidimicrobiales bacterium]|nr:DUF6339 family protein [Acidimicrobiales bacterium]